MVAALFDENHVASRLGELGADDRAAGSGAHDDHVGDELVLAFVVVVSEDHVRLGRDGVGGRAAGVSVGARCGR